MNGLWLSILNRSPRTNNNFGILSLIFSDALNHLNQLHVILITISSSSSSNSSGGGSSSSSSTSSNFIPNRIQTMKDRIHE